MYFYINMLRFLSSGSLELQKKNIPNQLKDSKHGVVMGVSSEKCDNGKVKALISECSQILFLFNKFFF